MNNLNPQGPEGILLVDKPQGLTSHDVVDFVRKLFRLKKVGHAGTLDPMATGLLLILVGKATKVSQYLMSLDKEYEGTIKLGQATDTHDAEGQIMEERPVPELDEAAIDEALALFRGDQYQLPPMFSAKKVQGKPLYKMARKGQEVEREERLIHVANIERTGLRTGLIDFRVRCSKGTYVRTIAHDLGQKLGCGAHLCALRRTAIDRFRVEKAETPEALEALSPSMLQRRLMPVYQAVPSHVL